ncbi:MAG: hypothetical protein AAB800_02925 [Patescibacteria group bacterium]
MIIETRTLPPNCASYALAHFKLCDGDLFVVPPSPSELDKQFERMASLYEAQLVVFAKVKGWEVVTYHMIVCHEDDRTRGSQRAISGADIEPDVSIPDKIINLREVHRGTSVLYYRKK